MTKTRRGIQTPVPDRSLKQREDALKRANVIRTFRASLKVDLKAGRARVAPVLVDPAGELATMKVFDLLMATPKFGKVKVNRILTACRISPSKTVGGLSPRQRAELAAIVARR